VSHLLNPPSTWVDKYGDYLYSFAHHRIQDDSLAQDLVQDTLVAALEAKERFKGTSSEKTWLTGILKHKIIDYIRKKYREPVFEDNIIETREMHDSFDDKGKWKTGPQKWASNPQHLLEQKAFLNIVKKMPSGSSQATGSCVGLARAGR